MKLATALISLLVIMVIAIIIRRADKVPPETPIIAVRREHRAWIRFSGSLMDARIECYDFAAIEGGEIVAVRTGRKTAAKIVAPVKK
jgi:hypothetical protein